MHSVGYYYGKLLLLGLLYIEGNCIELGLNYCFIISDMGLIHVIWVLLLLSAILYSF